MASSAVRPERHCLFTAQIDELRLLREITLACSGHKVEHLLIAGNYGRLVVVIIPGVSVVA